MEARFETIEHTADWAIRVYGRDLGEILAQAAHGMNSLLVEGVTAVARTHRRALTLEAYDAETLLVDWLSELAYWAESERLIFPQFELTVRDETKLAADLRGGPVPALAKHIKAVTYHNLAIRRRDGGLTAAIVFDV